MAEAIAAYAGTASLQVSGVAGDQLAFQTVTLSRCGGSMWRRSRGDTTIEDDSPERFTIVALGDGCSFYADPTWSTIQTGPGHLCTLAFPDGNHTLRVTDYACGPKSPGAATEPAKNIRGPPTPAQHPATEGGLAILVPT